MRFFEVSQWLKKFEEESSRLEKTRLLADFLSGVDLSEIDLVCYFLLGRLFPVFADSEFNFGEKSMMKSISRSAGVSLEDIEKSFKEVGDLGSVAEKFFQKKGFKNSELSFTQVFTELREIFSLKGIGSQIGRIDRMAKLLSQLDPLSVCYVVRFPLGKMRLGFTEKTMMDVFSWMLKGDKSIRSDLWKKYSVFPDIGFLAREIKKGGIDNLSQVQPQIGVPLLPALAERVSSEQEIIDRLKNFFLEPKVDGLRVQVHVGDSLLRLSEKVSSSQKSFFDENSLSNRSRFFSRGLIDMTNMFPQLAVFFSSLNLQEVIFDGELVAYDPETGKTSSFQSTMTRKRKFEIESKLKEVPVKIFLFDLLYLNGESLLEKPFSFRRSQLESLLAKQSSLKSGDKGWELIPSFVIDSVSDLRTKLDFFLEQGFEGVVCKRKDGCYKAGSRDHNWIKLKRVAGQSGLIDTIDAVVMGYYAGKGQRAKFKAGAFLVGLFNESSEQIESLVKIGTGLTEAQWREFEVLSADLESKSKPDLYEVDVSMFCDVWLEPGLIVEIDADEITRSPVHKAGGGLSLRFPRLVRFRDKSVDECGTIAELKRMFNS